MPSKDTQFKKRQIQHTKGNPIGRPPHYITRVREAIEEINPKTGNSYVYDIIVKWRDLALKGEPFALKDFMAFLLPRPKDPVVQIAIAQDYQKILLHVSEHSKELLPYHLDPEEENDTKTNND